VRWSAAVQKALLGMNWPETLLQWGDCQPVQDPNTGALLWRGLRVRMGMSWGRPSYKKPLNTGITLANTQSRNLIIRPHKHCIMCSDTFVYFIFQCCVSYAFNGVGLCMASCWASCKKPFNSAQLSLCKASPALHLCLFLYIAGLDGCWCDSC